MPARVKSLKGGVVCDEVDKRGNISICFEVNQKGNISVFFSTIYFGGAI